MSNEVPPQPSRSERNSRLYGMLCHLLALSLYIGVPFGNILGPLIMWLVKKDEYPFVDDQGKESLNFQISMMLYGVIAGVLVLIVIGIPLLIAIAAFDLVMVIIASIKANEGVPYRYPLTIRFIT